MANFWILEDQDIIISGTTLIAALGTTWRRALETESDWPHVPEMGFTHRYSPPLLSFHLSFTGGRHGCDRMCNQSLSPLMLWVRIPLQHYVIKFVSDLGQVGCFLHRYNWNIVESGVKHHKPWKLQKVMIDTNSQTNIKEKY